MSASWMSQPWALPGSVFLTLVAMSTICLWRLVAKFAALSKSAREQVLEIADMRTELREVNASLEAARAGFVKLARELTVDARFARGGVAADHRGIELAVRSARSGATEEDLVTTYGVSRQEAIFLRSLHGGLDLVAASLADKVCDSGAGTI